MKRQGRFSYSGRWSRPQPLSRKFKAEYGTRPPSLARIDTLAWEHRPPQGDRQFRIQSSDIESPGPIFVSPDVATCADCLGELLDPADRRYHYPFLNCTNCGPRLTIITGFPYDRERTTMARFPMCAACRADYEDPTNRRFHAQPTACPACGPRLQVLDAVGRPLTPTLSPPGGEGKGTDPLALFATEVLTGRIGALKGLGGYTLRG